MAKRKSKPASRAPEIVRRDGALCVNFVNTDSGKRPPLETYADLVAWGRQSGALSPSQTELLGLAAASRPEQARAVLAKAQTLRGCLLRILQAAGEDRTPVDLDLKAINNGLNAALSNRRLVADSKGGFQLIWNDGDDLDRMLWPVLVSATNVLTSKYCRRIRECANEGCRLLFLDRSPGSPRKWCRKETCGHRSRSRKHYQTHVKPRRARIKAWVRNKGRGEFF